MVACGKLPVETSATAASAVPGSEHGQQLHLRPPIRGHRPRSGDRLSGTRGLPARMNLDARSAIIITGALVLTETSRGMIDASATRKPCTPRTRSSLSTTAILSVAGPIRAVPAGWSTDLAVRRTKSRKASSSSNFPGAGRTKPVVICRSAGASKVRIASFVPRRSSSRSSGSERLPASNSAASLKSGERSLTEPRERGRRQHGLMDRPWASTGGRSTQPARNGRTWNCRSGTPPSETSTKPPLSTRFEVSGSV